MPRPARLLPLLALLVLPVLTAGCRGAALAGHGHEAEEARPAPLGASLACGWRDCVVPSHASRCGTPYVHAFHAEPAFLGRDLLVHLEREGEAHGLEAELEWALTRRLLLVLEVPYAWEDDEHGFEDVGAGLRALAVETDRFLLSAQIALEAPTGRDSEEALVAPSMMAWADLGHWVTAQGVVTLDTGLESGDTELSWGAALVKSFAMPPLLGPRRCSPGRAHAGLSHVGHTDDHGSSALPDAHSDGVHRHGSWLSLLLEGRGTYGLSGEEEGSARHEALLGVSLPLADGVDLRAGWTLLWEEGATDPEHGWVLGFVLHL